MARPLRAAVRLPTDAVEVVDRPFVVGDVVARADDPTGALGAVVKVSLRGRPRRLLADSVSVPRRRHHEIRGDAGEARSTGACRSRLRLLPN